jgi:arylsulfatase A-like enzyme
MNRRDLLIHAMSIGAASLLPSATFASPARRQPNIILILCDDLGFGDIEPYGGIIPTPNINRLASQSVMLDNYYAPANLCTPSRAGILTGMHPIRTGLGWEVLLANDQRGLPVSTRTIANYLKPSYATALIGKWHLGTAPQFWPPTRHGFDSFYGIPYSHDMKPLALFEASASTDKVVSRPVELSLLQQDFCAHAEAFISSHREEPFFFELALSAPHLPAVPASAFRRTSKAGSYGDVVEEIDSIVGRIVSRLDQEGLTDRTLIIFTSDNGPWYEGSPGPLRDRKGGEAYDGGSRVPFIARLPGVIPAGKRVKTIMSGLDMLPTICALAGVHLPNDAVLDGFDMLDVLKGAQGSPRQEILLFNNEDVAGVRTQRWKYVSQTYYRGGRSDYLERGFPQLYDMELEAGENYSVADLYPDILKDMQARWQAAVEKFKPLRTPRPPGFDWLAP